MIWMALHNRAASNQPCLLASRLFLPSSGLLVMPTVTKSDLHQREGRMFHIRVVRPEWAWECIERGWIADPKPEHKISLAP